MIAHRVAWRYLKSPRQGFISVIALFSFLGIMLGVATLIVVMGVMNGFQVELLDKLVGMRGHVLLYGQQSTMSNYQELAPQLERIPQVSRVIPMIEKQAILLARGQARGINIQALADKDFKKHALLAEQLPQDLLQPNTILLGKRLAEMLFLKKGDTVQILVPDGHTTPFGTLPRQQSFTIAGTFEVGMHEFDKSMVFMTLTGAQDFLKMGAKVTHLEIFAKTPDQTRTIIETIDELAMGQYRLVDWRHGDQAIFQAVQIEKNVMFIILTLIILIAAFNIISSLIMLVKDKIKDIAILRTMGASKTSILVIFILTGTTLGVLGTGMGIGLGLYVAHHLEYVRKILEYVTGANLFNAEVYFLSHLPCKIVVSEIVIVSSLALLLSLATLYPAWRAARLDPTEALRQ